MTELTYLPSNAWLKKEKEISADMLQNKQEGFN
jgi:hypothetical protein